MNVGTHSFHSLSSPDKKAEAALGGLQKIVRNPLICLGFELVVASSTDSQKRPTLSERLVAPKMPARVDVMPCERHRLATLGTTMASERITTDTLLLVAPTVRLSKL